MDVMKGFALAALATTVAFAGAQQRSRVPNPNVGAILEQQTRTHVPVTINGRPLTFPDQNPIMVGDEVMVPMRGVFEHLDAKVEWVASQRKVYASRGSTQVVLPVGVPLANINGTNHILDNPPFILNGRTMVPLRFLTITLHVGTVEMNNGEVVNILPNHGAESIAVVPPHNHLSPG
jgi:hypothetical protein